MPIRFAVTIYKCIDMPFYPPRRPFRVQGMVAIDGQDNPRATREFEADVVILHHSTTVAPGYQPVIHCGVVRQAAAILSMSGTESGMEALRTGQTATVRFRFMVRVGVCLYVNVCLALCVRACGVRAFTTRWSWCVVSCCVVGCVCVCVFLAGFSVFSFSQRGCANNQAGA